MKKVEKRILVLLALAQLILTLDSTVMNVSITTLVSDLHTTISQVQSAIAFYTLVMAAFMIAGAKVGDIIGRKKAFIIGLIIYGFGSAITAIAPNIIVLKFGWSLLEGLGAALIIPAMISLISSNFEAGPRRIKAFGTVAAMAAIGAGIGPIVGGVLTTYASWRFVFAGEVLIVLYILWYRKVIVDAPLEGAKPKMDWLGVALSASGMALVVQGILLASTYGFIHTRQAFTLNGKVLLAPGDVSPTVCFVAAGLLILFGFILWEGLRSKKAKDVLVHLKLFANQTVSSGIGSIFAIQFLLAGILYSMALYLQVELGYNALQTGIVMFPLSLMVLVLASRGSTMSMKFAPRRIVQTGFILALLGGGWIGLKAGSLQDGWAMFPCFVLVGAGVGIIFSQLQNLVQTAVTSKESAEASGLMATFQYLGASLGTAMSGVILMAVLIATAGGLISQNTTLTPTQKELLNSVYSTNAQIVSDDQLATSITNQSSEVEEEIIHINSQARQKSLSMVFILLTIISIFGLLSTINLPSNKPGKKALG